MMFVEEDIVRQKRETPAVLTKRKGYHHHLHEEYEEAMNTKCLFVWLACIEEQLELQETTLLVSDHCQGLWSRRCFHR